MHLWDLAVPAYQPSNGTQQVPVTTPGLTCRGAQGGGQGRRQGRCRCHARVGCVGGPPDAALLHDVDPHPLRGPIGNAREVDAEWGAGVGSRGAHVAGRAGVACMQQAAVVSSHGFKQAALSRVGWGASTADANGWPGSRPACTPACRQARQARWGGIRDPSPTGTHLPSTRTVQSSRCRSGRRARSRTSRGLYRRLRWSRSSLGRSRWRSTCTPHHRHRCCWLCRCRGRCTGSRPGSCRQ